MTRRIPQDHNYRTSSPAAIKAKITALEIAAFEYGVSYAYDWPSEDQDMADAQTARYALEQTILTCIDAAVKAALYPNTKRPASRAKAQTALAAREAKETE